MPLAVIRSRGLVAMSAPEVAVEVHLGNGLPCFQIVGLPHTEVRESRDRVRAALGHLDFEFPNRRITVNLAPADLPKESGRFDLPIALGILCASSQLPPRAFAEYEAVGELSLTGEVRPIRGAVAMALALKRAGQHRTLILPAANAREARLIQGVRVAAVRSLLEIKQVLTSGGSPAFEVAAPGAPRPAPELGVLDFADIKGHQTAKRMLEIAAAGEHSVLFVGPPGAGKSMLAQRLPSILPPLTDDESCEAAALASLAGRFEIRQWGRRPFRAPHHSASAPALVGGGANPRPGEISLAHRGVLFLDELPEFNRSVLESLREPLENGRITLSRALRQTDFPAQFQLIAAMNPCPCGYLGHADGRCRCTPEQVLRYRSRLSGPLLDRIDLRLDIPVVPATTLLSDAQGESSEQIRKRVAAAIERQQTRQGLANGRLAGPAIQLHCVVDSAAQSLLHQAVARLGLSARALHRVLKVARTIADLAAVPRIATEQVAEALQYRQMLNH